MGLIEKLEPYQNCKTSIDGYHWEYRPNLNDVIEKVNEIIDEINKNGGCGTKMDSPCSNCQEFDCYGCEVKMDERRENEID